LTHSAATKQVAARALGAQVDRDIAALSKVFGKAPAPHAASAQMDRGSGGSDTWNGDGLKALPAG
jgi:hypothetical protein